VSALARADAARLLEIARASLAHGLAHDCALPLDPAAESPALRAPGASFVTLRTAEQALRGCIGTLEPTHPLALDVAENAYRAGFRDPRFEPLRAAEAARVALHVSLLHAPERLTARSEAELIAQLRPGRDGLVLRLGARRATFLPEVWHELPSPAEFVRALQRKAGIPPGSWSEELEALRYTATAIGDALDLADA
jgi:AmmeMemoRadiSam system protein A